MANTVRRRLRFAAVSAFLLGALAYGAFTLHRIQITGQFADIIHEVSVPSTVTPQELYELTRETAAQRYFDPAELKNWQKFKNKYDNRIKTDEDAVKYANEMLQTIGDRYTRLAAPEAVKADEERRKGEFAGVGLIFAYKIDNGQIAKNDKGDIYPEEEKGFPLVSEVIADSPAAKAGVQPGDLILSINGASARNFTIKQLTAVLRDEVGTKVQIGLSRQGKPFSVDVVRATIRVSSVKSKRLGDIGYIKVSDFVQEGVTEDLANALYDFRDCKAIILDLRNNPGGYIDKSISAASMFIESGTVVSIKSRIPGPPDQPHYSTRTITLNSMSQVDSFQTDSGSKSANVTLRTPYWNEGRPLVILTNAGTASAAELFTGALKDNGVAYVIGTRTYGKGIGQSIVSMPNGTQLHVTSLRYFTPNGTWLGSGKGNADGLRPDKEVPAPKGAFKQAQKGDWQFEAALKYLRKKLDP